ncbi:uncharacterized protein [Cicer arietinum]|uniref:uncharacterized protein n=1 Tax=Cicer arietinum TaxID=3827 RepID=UPI003CC552CE
MHVVLAANDSPSTNDVTYPELSEIISKGCSSGLKLVAFLVKTVGLGRVQTISLASVGETYAQANFDEAALKIPRPTLLERYSKRCYKKKRGLPHAHILVFLHSEDKIQTPSKIDDTISAEISDKDIDPLTFSAVERFMIHGPCGLDRVRAVISNVENFDNSSTSSMHFHDEIKEYLDCRYISPSEASWRIFKFNMFFRELAVERLSFHHGKQTIYFPESMRISTILNREGIETTMFTKWMKMNSVDMEARQLTYTEFPTKYVWNKTSKKWTRRKNGRQRRLLNFPDLHLSDDLLKNYALLEIQKHFRKVDKSLEDYKGMAIPNSNVIEEANNRLITEELNYDMLKMHEEYSQLLQGLNSDQKLFFVYGSGGMGKTYLWRTLLAKLRSKGKIALAVATSDIAALLPPGGRTFESK